MSGKIPLIFETSSDSSVASVPYQSTVNTSSWSSALSWLSGLSCWVGLTLPTPESLSDSSSSLGCGSDEVIDEILEDVIGGSSSKFAKIWRVFCPMYNVYASKYFFIIVGSFIFFRIVLRSFWLDGEKKDIIFVSASQMLTSPGRDLIWTGVDVPAISSM